MDRQKEKKPLHKRWWVWVVGAIMVYNIFIASDTADEKAEADTDDDEKIEEVQTEDDGKNESNKLEGEDLKDNQRERIQKRFDEIIESSEGIVIDI